MHTEEANGRLAGSGLPQGNDGKTVSRFVFDAESETILRRANVWIRKGLLRIATTIFRAY